VMVGSAVNVCAQDTPALDTPENPKKSETSNQLDPKQGSRPERETREIFFRTLSETRSRGAQELGYLLFQKSVREEIGLDDQSAKAAREVLSQTRSAAEKLYDQLKAKEISAVELKTEMSKIMADADRDIWEALGESKSKRDRLIGLFVQHRHASAVLNKVVAEKIGLAEPRRQEIVGKKEAIEREMFEAGSRQMSSNSPGDRFRSWEKAQKKIDIAISEMLTEEQRSKLEALKGDPFKFEEFQFPPGPPPGPPPGRGRDGSRDGGRDRDPNRRENDREEKCRDCDKLVGDRK